jgi:hypothetical protein
MATPLTLIYANGSVVETTYPRLLETGEKINLGGPEYIWEVETADLHGRWAVARPSP